MCGEGTDRGVTAREHRSPKLAQLITPADAIISACIHYVAHKSKFQFSHLIFIDEGNMTLFCQWDINALWRFLWTFHSSDVKREMCVFVSSFSAKNVHISLETQQPTCNHNTINTRKNVNSVSSIKYNGKEPGLPMVVLSSWTRTKTT